MPGRIPLRDYFDTTFRPIPLKVGYRRMTCAYAGNDETAAATLWLPGPAVASQGLMQRLCADLVRPLAARSIASCLFTGPDWSCPMYVCDGLRALLDRLEAQGISSFALVGHSLGATLSLWAASDDPRVRSLVSLSATCIGPGPAATLGPGCSLILIHGDRDETTSHNNSDHLYQIAAEPKQQILLRGADHIFTDHLDELRLLLRGWLVGELAPPCPAFAPSRIPSPALP